MVSFVVEILALLGTRYLGCGYHDEINLTASALKRSLALSLCPELLL